MQKCLKQIYVTLFILSLLLYFTSSCFLLEFQFTKRLYFAHAVNSYGTEFEKKSLLAIEKRFPGYQVENPNQQHHQDGYQIYAMRTKESSTKHKGMNYFFEEVLPKTDAVVAMPYLDGKWGLGVAGEAKWALKRGLPVWIIEWQNKMPRIRPISELEKYLLLHESPGWVLSHHETRLRTWKIYYKEKRPYEEAHLVKMPLPPGFYTDEKK